ncbi:hypothetical protein JCM9279_001843 [Rhodotorula babjevae]
MSYRPESPRPIHEPVDHDGPLRTAEEEVREWRSYIEHLQGKLVEDDQDEIRRREDLLKASRVQADAAVRAHEDWMRYNELTIVEREREVEGLISVAKHGRGAAARRIAVRQELLRKDENKIAGVRRRDKVVNFFNPSARERRRQNFQQHNTVLCLSRQEIGNLVGERQYQDDLVSGYENLLSTLRNALRHDQEHVYNAPPPTYDARPDRPPSRHREEHTAPPSHRVPRRTLSRRPNTRYSLVRIDISDLNLNDQGDELGHEAIPRHYPPSAALGGAHAEHAAAHVTDSTRTARYNPDLERRPTIRSSGNARHPRHSWVPSSPINSHNLLSPVERNAAFPWDETEDEPTEPEPAASRYHPGPLPGDLRVVTSVGGSRPLASHPEGREVLHANNAAHGFTRLPDYDAINLAAMSPDTPHERR